MIIQEGDLTLRERSEIANGGSEAGYNEFDDFP